MQKDALTMLQPTNNEQGWHLPRILAPDLPSCTREA
jgi:hypothetical protein